MSDWPSAKSGEVLKALYTIGWSLKRHAGSHKVLQRDGWPDYIFAFHDGVEIGPKMMSRIGRSTGLTPKDMR